MYWEVRGVHTHVSTVPQSPLPLRLPHNIEQSFMCYRVGPCQLSILNIAAYTCSSQTPNYPLPPFFSLATINFFLSLWACFCFKSRFVCIVSFQIPHIRNVIWYSSFSVWFALLSMTISRSIHVAADGIISFFFYDWTVLRFLVVVLLRQGNASVCVWRGEASGSSK